MSGSTGFELAAQQEQLWSAQPDGPSLRAQIGFTLSGAPTAAAVRAALVEVVARHEVLRTTFERPVGLSVPVQIVHDELAPAFAEAEAADDAALAALAAREANADLDHATGPLFRALLVAQSAGAPALILTASAAVADAASLELVAGEIRDALGGNASSSAPIQYVDYTGWQGEQLADDTSAGREWWSTQDLAATPQLRLPLLGAAEAASPVAVPVPLDDLAARVSVYAGAVGAGDDDVYLAVWAAFAARMTGADELVIGVETPGRANDELADAVGPFTKVVPIALDIDPESGISELVARTRAARANAMRHAELLAPASTGRAPAQVDVVAFAWEAAGPDVFVRVGHALPFQAKLGADPSGARLWVDASVDNEVAASTARHLATFAAAALDAPDRPVGDLPLVGAADADALARMYASGPVEAVPTATVVEMFAEQCERTPERVAVAGSDGSLTYADLHTQANRLAHLLIARGVGVGSTVGVFLDRTCAQIVAILAALKAGAAYVPLHIDHPAERLEFQLADAEVRVVLSTAELGARLPAGGPELIALDASPAADQPVAAPPVAAGADDIAYVIYTSGSTGTPKGVAVTHRGLANYTHDLVRRLALGDDALHVGLVTSVTTDLGNTALFPALASGCCLHIFSTETARDPALYAAYVAAQPIDVLKITPSHLHALLGAEGDAVLPRRHLVLGGEASPWALVDRVLASGACAVLNHYGPTETTVGSLTFDLAGAAAVHREVPVVPIGRPISNTEVYILGRDLQPLPIGAPGELCIAGAGVARGYLQQPEQTAERFVAHPFSSSPGARLYRTGDLSRFLSDGTVAFLGRIDTQVKLRGFRVELAEIEQALRDQPGITQAAVLLQGDGPDDARLVAYVVGASPDTAELRAGLSRRLPDYMVPAAYVALSALPLTPSGKLDRKALPSLDQMPSDDSRAITEPRTETEVAIAAIWVEVLREPRVGADDDFFALGGHSLLATQIIAQIRTTFDVQLPLHSIFTSSTVEALAVLVDDARAAAAPEDDLDAMLARLEDLTDQEVEELLKRAGDR